MTVALLFSLTGCAATGPQTPVMPGSSLSVTPVVVTPAPPPPPPPPSSAQGKASANVAGGALAGAAAGCALATLVGQQCADGAAIGAVLGAAIGWSTYSEKVAGAQSVNQQARREGLPVPENEIRLKNYTLTPSASVVSAGGGVLRVVGDIELYGQSRRNPEVVQSMLLYKNSEPASDIPQMARVEKADGAGRYRAVGVYKIARGMELGPYRVQSTLLIDGKVVARRETQFQVGR